MRSKASLMSAVQSSGSICSASVVDPTTSAKRAVTGLRSPVSRAARILVTSGVGPAASKRLWIAASVVDGSPSGWPQFGQNRASAATAASQRGQLCGGDSTLIGPIVAQGGHGARSGDRRRSAVRGLLPRGRAFSPRQAGLLSSGSCPWPLIWILGPWAGPLPVIRPSGRPRRRCLIDRIPIALTITLYDFQAQP